MPATMQHADILEDREELRGPLMQSLLLHVVVAAVLVAYGSWSARARVLWGDPMGLGGAVGITPVSQIPLPAKGGRPNPLASDTENQAPLPPPKPAAKPAVKEDPAAKEIPSRQAVKAKPQAASRQTYRASREERTNQIYSSQGQALSSPLIGAAGGTGGIGIGGGSFGNRYGYYVDLLRRRVAEKWDTTSVDPRILTAPPAIVTFEILRNGQVRNIRMAQSSGIPSLDYSAQRAIYDASPFPPLPPGFERDSAAIEFQFFLKR